MNLTKKIILFFALLFFVFTFINNYLILKTAASAEFFRLLINSIIIAGCFIIITAIFLYYNLTDKFRKTIEKLDDIISLKNYSDRLELNENSNEFYSLKNSINELLSIIEERENQLLKYNENLNEQIKYKTLQLSEKVLELKTANEKLIQADKIKDDFLSVMAHELKTPITTISAYIETIQSGIVDENDKTEFYEIIMSEIMRLTRLINNVLDITKYERNKLKLNFEHVKPVKILRQICAGAVRDMEQKKIKLNTDFPIHTQIDISADGDSLKQVFYNLINNAIKFNKKQGFINISSQICDASDINNNREKTAAKYLCINIQDSGIGIPEDKISRIWEKFGRAADDYYEGVGLGLTVSKNIVSLHHGFIEVTSKYEEGSTFSIYLPINS